MTDVQAEAILNMRLRSPCASLEEMELRAERDALMDERAGLADLLDSDRLQWKQIGDRAGRHPQASSARARPAATAAPSSPKRARSKTCPIEAMIEREPITVICSKMGWIRAMKGHVDLTAEQKFKDGDGPRFAFHAETTDKILLVAENGRFYTLIGANLPGGRGMGEPVRLMIDLPNDTGITDLILFRPGVKFLVASSAGDGFVVPV